MTVLGGVAPWESVAAAGVTAVTAAVVTVWQGSKTRTTNTREHGDTNRNLLDLHHKVDQVVDKLDEHIREHRDGL